MNLNNLPDPLPTIKHKRVQLHFDILPVLNKFLRWTTDEGYF